MEDMGSTLHQLNIISSWIYMLTVLNWICESVVELLRITTCDWAKDLSRDNNTLRVPNRFGLTKLTIQWYSRRLFWRGVPVKIILLFVLIWFTCELRLVSEFYSNINQLQTRNTSTNHKLTFKICPSSQITISGPGSTKNVLNCRLKNFFREFFSSKEHKLRNMA